MFLYHDDVIKWKHFPRYWPFVRGIHRSPVNSPHKGQWRGALMFTLICARINGWVNNREAGDLRRYSTHYDVIVMYIIILIIMANINAEHFAYKLYPPREGHLFSVSTTLELPTPYDNLPCYVISCSVYVSRILCLGIVIVNVTGHGNKDFLYLYLSMSVVWWSGVSSFHLQPTDFLHWHTVSGYIAVTELNWEGTD